MTTSIDISVFKQYVVMYPYRGESGYDGVHNGGIKCLNSDAPAEAVEMFEKFIKAKDKTRHKTTKK